MFIFSSDSVWICICFCFILFLLLRLHLLLFPFNWKIKSLRESEITKSSTKKPPSPPSWYREKFSSFINLPTVHTEHIPYLIHVHVCTVGMYCTVRTGLYLTRIQSNVGNSLIVNRYFGWLSHASSAKAISVLFSSSIILNIREREREDDSRVFPHIT